MAKNLKEGVNYKFRVKAENIYGAGEPLESSKVLMKNPFGKKTEQDENNLFVCYVFRSM